MTPTPDIDTHANWLSEAWRLIDRIDSPGSYSIAEGHLEGAPTGLDTEALWVDLEGKRQELWKASGALQP